MLNNYIKNHKLSFLAIIMAVILILTAALYPAVIHGSLFALIPLLLLTTLTMLILMRYG